MLSYDVICDENDEDFQQCLIFAYRKVLKEHGGSSDDFMLKNKRERTQDL
jgi:hypothetical protein